MNIQNLDLLDEHRSTEEYCYQVNTINAYIAVHIPIQSYLRFHSKYTT